MHSQEINTDLWLLLWHLKRIRDGKPVCVFKKINKLKLRKWNIIKIAESLTVSETAMNEVYGDSGYTLVSIMTSLNLYHPIKFTHNKGNENNIWIKK